MYQKCPVCNGTGVAMNVRGNTIACSVCQGKKIISQLNGLPPNSKDVNSNTTHTETDFKDFPMESFDEYFGLVKNKNKQI